MAKDKNKHTHDLNATTLQISAVQFYRGVAALMLLCATVVAAAYMKTSSEIETMREEFRDVLASNSKMEGQLQIYLPMLNGAMLKEIALKPNSYGFNSLKNANFSDLKTGINFVDENYLTQLKQSEYWGEEVISDPVVENGWGIVECDAEGLGGMVKCTGELEIKNDFEDIFKRLEKNPS